MMAEIYIYTCLQICFGSLVTETDVLKLRAKMWTSD